MHLLQRFRGVNRTTERNIGITLPTSISLTPQANPNTTTTSGSTPTTGKGALFNSTVRPITS